PRLLLGLADEPLHDRREGAALRVRAGSHVARQFAVEAPRLTSGRVEASVGGEVTMHRDDPLLQRGRPDQVEEEALPAPVLTDHEADRGSAVDDPVEVTQERRDLAGT